MNDLYLAFQCPSCGSAEGEEQGNLVRCRHCGNKYRKNLKNEPIYADLSYAVNERQEADFDKARRRYDSLIATYGSESGMEEAYWGRFLCEQYVIFYQNDVGESIPSFWNISEESCTRSVSYQKALEYGELSGNRENYEKLAAQIEEYKSKYRQVRRECPEGSQIFICFKDSGTDDANLGYTIYNKFAGKYNIFFSRQSLNNIRGNDYEPYIYHALTTAKVLIVICSDRKNLESKWVHNEWWRFWKFAKGTEKTIIPVCRRHFDPSQLPDELRSCQAHKEDVALLSVLSERLDAILKNDETGALTSFGKQLNIVDALLASDRVDDAKIRILELLQESAGRPHDHVSALLLQTKILSNNYRRLGNSNAKASIAHAKAMAKEHDIAIEDMPEYRQYRAARGRRRFRRAAITLLLIGVLGAAAFLGWSAVTDSTVASVYNSKYHATVDPVSGGLPKDTEFQVVESAGDSTVQAMIRSLPIVQSSCHLYDMELWHRGYEYDAEFPVTVTMTLPAGISAERAVVYYMSGDTPEQLESQVLDGEISFTTDHFSLYLIAEAKEGCDHIIVTDPAVPATCTEEGWSEGTHCSLCNEVLSVSELIPALGHTPGAEATCTDGQNCTVCHVELAAATGHRAGAAATCVDAQRCTACDVELAPAKGHTPGAAATCTDGQHCAVCRIELAPAKGHTRSDTATCTEAQYCTVCRVELSPAKGHTVESATCTKAEICVTCGTELSAALGHKPGAAATCTTAQLCTICYAEITPALGHRMGANASCTTASNCIVCGTQLSAASGHKPNGEATCTTASQCTVCGYLLAPAKGHTAGNNATCTEPSSCIVCGIQLSAPTGHRYTNWVINREMTSDMPGLKTGICSICGAATLQEFKYTEGLAFTANSNGTYTVTGIGTCTDTSIVIPATHEGAAVTAIANTAFQNCTSLVSVEIPSSVLTIGEGAFLGCSKLTTLKLNEGLETIKARAFYKCPITEVVIPNSVISMDVPSGSYYDSNSYHGAFEGCSRLTSVVIGNGLTKIDRESFQNCTALTSVVIGNGVETIGQSAFAGCTSLTEITMGGWVKSIGANAFDGCSKLATVDLGDTVETIGNFAFQNCVLLTMIDIPSSVKTIGEGVFLGCSRLAMVTLHEGLETIKSRAFYKCPITQIVIPNSVISMPVPSGTYYDSNSYHGAFEGCSRLISVVIGNGLTKIDRESFQNCTALTSVVIGDGVETIGPSAFAGCTALTKVTMGGWVKSIGANAFDGCSKLATVDFGNTVETIGNFAFQNCIALTAIEIPSSVKTIGEGAFLGCSRLASLTLNEGLESIKSRAFYKCPITELTIPNSVTSMPVPSGSYYDSNSYHGAFEGCSKLTTLVIGDGLTKIERESFQNCTALTSVVIGDGVETIGPSAFAGCTSLTEITMGGWVKSIGTNAFDGCSRLTSVDLGNTLETIGDFAFQNCTSLTAIEIPSSVKTISEGAFLGCSRLASLTLNEGLESIKSRAFYKCPITKLIIPDSVTSMPVPSGSYYDSNSYHGAFEGCSKLTTLVIGDGLTKIERESFQNCTALTSVKFGDGVEIIDQYAFGGCISLTEITIGGWVQSIGSYAFNGCTRLASVKLGNMLETIGTFSFQNCTSLTAIEIPSRVKTISEAAFLGCSSLSTVVLHEGLESIKSRAFYQCPITEITIPNSVTSMPVPSGSYFDGNSYHGAFEGCSKLTSVVIGNGLSKLERETFKGCTALSSIRFAGTVEQWNTMTFANDWKSGAPATAVSCTNGSITLSE